jgi:hypothetical protein
MSLSEACRRMAMPTHRMVMKNHWLLTYAPKFGVLYSVVVKNRHKKEPDFLSQISTKEC